MLICCFGCFSEFYKHRGFNADRVFDADFFAQLATDTFLRFNKFADAEETFRMFTSVRILEFKTLPRTNMDTEIASRAEFFVDNGDRTVCGAADELTHLAKLIANCFDGTDHPARSAIDAYVWIDDVQHVPVPCNRVNGTIRQTRHTPNTFVGDIVCHGSFSCFLSRTELSYFFT